MRRRSHKVRRRAPGWSQSAAFRNIASVAIKAFHAKRHLLPKCGATAKSTGLPCGNLAMTNGRCYAHGGKTPAGIDWHKPQWPGKNAPNWNAKLNRKLADLERRRKLKVRKLAAMSPEQRQKYDAWQRSHLPGAPWLRQQKRDEKNGRLQRVLAEKIETPTNPEIDQLTARIAELKREKRENEARRALHPEFREGVFG
jgi:hypothetical protein